MFLIFCFLWFFEFVVVEVESVVEDEVVGCLYSGCKK